MEQKIRGAGLSDSGWLVVIVEVFYSEFQFETLYHYVFKDILILCVFRDVFE